MPTVAAWASQAAATKGEDARVESVGREVARFPGARGQVAFDVWGVFDGHGGDASARLAAGELLACFHDALREVAGDEGWASARAGWEACHVEALRRAFAELDARCRARFTRSGTTATVVVLTREEEGDERSRVLLTVANVGDSHVYLDVGSQVLRLNEDHRLAGNRAEIQRIEAGGGTVERADRDSPLRLFPGGLMMSRTIGDPDAPLAIAEPAISRVALLAEPGMGVGRLILASDGLWDAISPKECCNLVRGKAHAQAACAFLVHEASKREGRQGDDVTVTVVDLLGGAPGAAPAFVSANAKYDTPQTRRIIIWKPLKENTPDFLLRLQREYDWLQSRRDVADPAVVAEFTVGQTVLQRGKPFRVAGVEGPMVNLQGHGWFPARELSAIPENDVAIWPAREAAEVFHVVEEREDDGAFEVVKSKHKHKEKKKNEEVVVSSSTKVRAPKGTRNESVSTTSESETVQKNKLERRQRTKDPQLEVAGAGDVWTVDDVRTFFSAFHPVRSVRQHRTTFFVSFNNNSAGSAAALVERVAGEYHLSNGMIITAAATKE